MTDENIMCRRCGSENLVERGKVLNEKKTTWKQRYYCNDCHLKFVEKKAHMRDSYAEPEFVYTPKPERSINWHNYDKAQLNEKQLFFETINDLLELFSFEQINKGRPMFDPKDTIFGMLVKIYNKNSARRTISDLKLLKELGYIKRVPSFSTLMAHFNKQEFKSILDKLIELTSLPLKDIEEDFAADSSGFSTSQFGHWNAEKWGNEKTKRIFRKAHIMIGVKTNTITNCVITKQQGIGTGDSTQFKPLLNKTVLNFKVKEVSADMAYLSRDNLEAVVNAGALPYIPFKSNVTGGNNGLIWRKMYLYAKDSPQEFFEHYHKRSNVETAFFMIKQKFGQNLMTKNYVANVNEILCKIVSHNICCLISAYYELELEKAFQTKAQETSPIQILL